MIIKSGRLDNLSSSPRIVFLLIFKFNYDEIFSVHKVEKLKPVPLYVKSWFQPFGTFHNCATFSSLSSPQRLVCLAS